MGQANGMRATCSLEQAIPEISAAHIKNISCPELFVSQHRAPGFYMQISRIVEFVQAHPVSGSYYVTHVLDTLKRNEPTCYASITSGKQPETLGEIFILLANRFLLPNATENLMLSVLMTNGRLCQPGNTNTTNVKSQVEREIQKTLVFQGVLENILMMRHYFERVYENDKARFNELVSSGCFTFKGPDRELAYRVEYTDWVSRSLTTTQENGPSYSPKLIKI